MMNLGYIEATQGEFVARVYYDATGHNITTRGATSALELGSPV